MNWPAITAARAHDPSRRLPFFIGSHLVGSVAHEHLTVLRDWPQALQVDRAAVRLVGAEPTAVLVSVNAALREQGLVQGWRDEPFAIFSLDDGSRLARTERAAARFWGTLTLAAHANGYVAGPGGRPTHLWIAQRAFDKATDPGLFDSLVGGGVPDGQTPHEALLREGWEEAGQNEARMRTATPGRVLRLQRDIPEGLQLEDLHVWDLALPAGVAPQNQDGEVQAFRCLPLAEALALAAGDTMTVDAALVTLDFALRHALLAPPAGAAALFDTA
jgi:8-oxo-dGTP pyrophosphatase MutT (NUDIX family)